MQRNRKEIKGFSILEVTVALGILSMGLLGISSLIVQNLQAQNINQNYFIASMLAQEGAELIRNKRDYNWLKFNYDKWSTGDDAHYDIIQDGDYVVDYTGVINDSVDLIVDAKLYLDSFGFYGHTVATGTPFFRLVTVDSSGMPDLIEVKVKVQWQERGRTHDYDVDFELYNWR